MTYFGFRRPCHATLSTRDITRERAVWIDTPKLTTKVVLRYHTIMTNQIKYKRRLTVYYINDNLIHKALHLYYIIVSVLYLK